MPRTHLHPNNPFSEGCCPPTFKLRNIFDLKDIALRSKAERSGKKWHMFFDPLFTLPIFRLPSNHLPANGYHAYARLNYSLKKEVDDSALFHSLPLPLPLSSSYHSTPLHPSTLCSTYLMKTAGLSKRVVANSLPYHIITSTNPLRKNIISFFSSLPPFLPSSLPPSFPFFLFSFLPFFPPLP